MDLLRFLVAVLLSLGCLAGAGLWVPRGVRLLSADSYATRWGAMRAGQSPAGGAHRAGGREGTAGRAHSARAQRGKAGGAHNARVREDMARGVHDVLQGQGGQRKDDRLLLQLLRPHDSLGPPHAETPGDDGEGAERESDALLGDLNATAHATMGITAMSSEQGPGMLGGRKGSLDGFMWQPREYPRSNWRRRCFPTGPANLRWPKFQERLAGRFRYSVCSGKRIVHISPEHSGVVWKGFGTSLANMGRFLGSLPRWRLDCFVTFLTDPVDGLGLNIVRYQIPGGFNPLYSPALARYQWAERGYHPYKWVWWDLQSRMAGYDWQADAKQVRALRAFNGRKGMLFDAVALSPPWWMTKSKDVGGGPGSSNILPLYRAHYALYLADIVTHFAYSWRAGAPVLFDGLSPFNEALEGWWAGNSTQEGCNLSREDLPIIAAHLQRCLGNRGLKTKVAGIDSWISWSGSEIWANKGLHSLARITVHGYHAPEQMNPRDDYTRFSRLRETAQKLPNRPPIWVTEWSPKWFAQGRIPATPHDGGLLLARIITQHINIAGAEAWLYWQAIAVLGSYHGLMQMDFDKPQSLQNEVLLNKNYHAMIHFTRNIRPGSRPLVIREECQHTVVAVYTPERRMISIIITNQRTEQSPLWFHITGFVPNYRTKPVRAIQFRTSKYENYKKVRDWNVAVPGWFFVTAGHETVNTIQIHNVYAWMSE